MYFSSVVLIQQTSNDIGLTIYKLKLAVINVYNFLLSFTCIIKNIFDT